MATIKTVAKFICNEYGLDYDEVILKIYNDENNTCLPTIKEERTYFSQDLRQELEQNDNNVKTDVFNENPNDELTFDPMDFIDELEDDEGNKVFRCMKCNKDYKKVGKSVFKHIKKCINEQ